MDNSKRPIGIPQVGDRGLQGAISEILKKQRSEFDIELHEKREEIKFTNPMKFGYYDENNQFIEQSHLPLKFDFRKL